MVRHQKNNNSYANHVIITSDLDTFHRLYDRIIHNRYCKNLKYIGDVVLCNGIIFFDIAAIMKFANCVNRKLKRQFLNMKCLCKKMCVMEENVSSSCQFCILSTTIYTCHWWAQHVFFKYSVGMLPVSFCYMHVNTPNVLKLSAKRVLFVYRYFNFWYFTLQ